jgi:hypothetical protein
MILLKVPQYVPSKGYVNEYYTGDECPECKLVGFLSKGKAAVICLNCSGKGVINRVRCTRTGAPWKGK